MITRLSTTVVATKLSVVSDITSYFSLFMNPRMRLSLFNFSSAAINLKESSFVGPLFGSLLLVNPLSTRETMKFTKDFDVEARITHLVTR